MEAALGFVEQEDVASIGATVQMVRPRRLIDLIFTESSYPSLLQLVNTGTGNFMRSGTT
jgi:hypothetical protein